MAQNLDIRSEALTIVLISVLELILSENPELRDRAIARIEQIGEAIPNAEGRDDIADALAWLRRI
jgi:hypothetical protein